MVDQNKQELYRSIWNLANDLRGAIDASEFRDYILGFLFYKYISADFIKFINTRPGMSESYKGYENEDNDEEWIEYMKDILIQEKGYFISPNDLFSRVKKRLKKGDIKIEDLGDELHNIFNRIEESTQYSNARKNFEGLFKLIDLDDNKLGKEVIQRNEKLKEIIDGIETINCQLGSSDIFGDAYEYLIGMYADNAGKAGGEFYTPPEVSKLLVKLVSSKKEEIKTVYDPTCGSGSLLLKFGSDKDICFYGQEINFTTYNLCKINMFLHQIEYNKFQIVCGNTLMDDKFKDLKFDAIVSNPPFGTKWAGSDEPELKEDPRFAPAGVLAPKWASDFAFIMHSLYHLKPGGIAAIVCYPGILFRDKSEKEIRKYLIQNDYVEAVIQLTDRLFFGTGIATSILVLKKKEDNEEQLENEKKEEEEDRGVLFINAENLFVKAKTRNKLDDHSIELIYEAYQKREDKENFSRVVSRKEIKEKDYSLSIDAYICKEKFEDAVNIEQINKDVTELNEEVYKLNQYIDELIQNF